MVDREKDTEPIFLSSFQKFDEINALLNDLLSVSLTAEPSDQENQVEQGWLNALTQILDEHQEQPNLLDPYLERLIVPVVGKLRDHVGYSTTESSGAVSLTRVNRLAWTMYGFIKVRGHKTIVRFFPHDVSDLPMVIKYMTSAEPVKVEHAWTLRYIVTLWLSLVCMLPFDLTQFDEEDRATARSLERIGMAELSKPGLERDGAALLLSRLYMRKDTSALLASFLESFQKTLQQSPNLFVVIGSLRVFSEIAKSTPFDLLQPHLPQIQVLVNEVSRIDVLSQNTVVRKLRAKCISRIATRLLPTGPKRVRGAAKHLDPSIRGDDEYNDDEEMDVPDEVEVALGELFELLQDKDTFVRWSTAKGLANISERLPSSFVDQIIDNILEHYSVYGTDTVPSELPATAEHPWHGATLASAELARRNLISADRLPDVLLWTRKALFFDVQKGSFSVGSNVRDAAAYVLWSLARTRSAETVEKYANDLARDLVTAALFDREIHIRRAASAAFQENVGRMGLFPHGIAIIGLVDFYSVGIRRHAFLVAATEVYRYKEYQSAISQHLLRITLRHWDEAMRRLGAQSLRAVCETDLENNLPGALDTLPTLLHSVDTKDVHGALLALSELAGALEISNARGRMQHHRRKIFSLIDFVPSSLILSPRNHLILEATCYLVANALSSEESGALDKSSIEPYWKSIIFHGLKSRNSGVQEAAAAAIHSLSRLRDCSKDCKRWLKRSSGIIQQSLARVLGSFDYSSHGNGFDVALPFLLEVVDPKSSGFFRQVEARRNAYASIAAIVNCIVAGLDIYISPSMMNNIWETFFAGLEDYTVNERGDVGSWVRLACIEGVSSMLELFIASARFEGKDHPLVWAESYSNFSRYLPPKVYHTAIGSILKQGVERLDNVRQCVGKLLPRLLKVTSPSFDRGEEWNIRGREKFIALLDTAESPGWNDGVWLYPKAVRFLDIKTYRDPILRGLLLSIGSKTSSTQHVASSAMLSYARDLPSVIKRDQESNINFEDSNDRYTLLSDVLTIALENPKLNNTVIPVLHLFNVFLEGDVVSNVVIEKEGEYPDLLSKMVELASRNIKRVQSIQRIDESMKIVINMLGIRSPILSKQALSRLELFLLHPFPKIRNDTAEVLYVALQTKDIEYEPEAEEILLETEWSTDDVASLRAPVHKLLDSILS